MRISDWSSDVCSSDLAGSGIAMLETEQSLWRDEEMAAAFRLLDRILLAFFSIEYLLRFWTAGEVAAWRSWRGRLVWMARPWHLFDLFLIAVFLLPHLGTAIFILRRSEEHTSELQSLMRISYAVFCLKKKTTIN